MKNIWALCLAIFALAGTTNCESSVLEKKDFTVREVLEEIEKGTSISLRLQPTFVGIIRGVGGGDVSSETNDVGFEIVKYVSKVDMEYGLHFFQEECHGDTYFRGWYIFCMKSRYADTQIIIDFIEPELFYDSPKW